MELAAAARATAEKLPPGDERDAMLVHAHECDVAVEINAWFAHQPK